MSAKNQTTESKSAKQDDVKAKTFNPFDQEIFEPLKVLPPIETINNDDLSERDMMTLISASVEETGLVGHNIKPFNKLLDTGLKQIVTEMFEVDRMIKNDRTQTVNDRRHKSTRLQIEFSDLQVGKPTYTTYPVGKVENSYPNRARLCSAPYSGAVTLAATVKMTAHYDGGEQVVKSVEIPPFQATKFPIMKGSNRCHTVNCTRSAIKNLEEDPIEPGGYFIAKANEWIVDLSENIRFNSLHLHLKMSASEISRGEFISQPGGPFENSSQIVIRHMANDLITIEINSTKLSGLKIPFYHIYRILGMTSDEQIVDTIVLDAKNPSPVSVKIMQQLEKALHATDTTFAPLKDEMSRETIIRAIAEKLATSSFMTRTGSYQSVDSAIQYLNSDLMSILDKVLLPHMGITQESRRRKLRFIGLMINKILLAEMGIVPPTDRDSYRHKRAHGAGVSLAKAFKTQFNSCVIIPILRAFRRELKNNSFESISASNIKDIFTNSLLTPDFVRAMERVLTAGNGKPVIIKQKFQNTRVASQNMERKNMLNVLSSLRTVTTHSSSNASKQTVRADLMRRVHPSFIGYICVAQSADTGENVGMRKQLAITADVCDAGDQIMLKMRLLADTSHIIPLDLATNKDVIENKWARVMVNGEWIGYCHSAHKLAARYRALRRENRIVDPRTTIYWDLTLGEIEFCLDLGRLIRPLLIVYNNLEEYKAACREAFKTGDKSKKIKFVQNTRFTKRHVEGILRGTMTMEQLRMEGVIEYITPEEQENCLVASSLTVLKENRNNVFKRFTHCDVKQAIFGLAALVSPYGTHTQPARITYETNQSRQTCGWFALSFPFRTDKNRFWQNYNQIPLVRTLAHKFVLPNGYNIKTLYGSYKGNNMEDSSILNKGPLDRGLFDGAFYRTEKAELEKGESFSTPDPLTTKNMKPDASYEKLVDGFVPAGTIIRRGDVVIGRIAKITKTKGTDVDSKFQFIDRSIVYRLDEPAVVESVLRPRGVNDETSGLVKLRFARPLRVGDKLSSRSGNKNIVAIILSQMDMPFTESGETPDIIVNPHSIPSRMTIGQLLETSVAKVCARNGVIADGTMGLSISYESLGKELLKYGFRYNGREVMHNGFTGDYFDTAMFIGNVYEQRLQKFVLDDEYSVGGNGPTDATTGQPLGGKNAGGGLRIGEMETWCLESHGSIANLHEKYYEDSDGRKIHVCRSCGNMAVCNPTYNIYSCRTCGEAADISTVDSSKSATIFQQELAAANIKFSMGLKRREFEEYL